MGLLLFPSERISPAGDKIQGDQHEVMGVSCAFLVVVKCECHCI